MKSMCRIPAATFVTIWEASVTVAEASSKLKMSAKAAGARASRRRGQVSML